MRLQPGLLRGASPKVRRAMWTELGSPAPFSAAHAAEGCTSFGSLNPQTFLCSVFSFQHLRNHNTRQLEVKVTLSFFFFFFTYSVHIAPLQYDCL